MQLVICQRFPQTKLAERSLRKNSLFKDCQKLKKLWYRSYHCFFAYHVFFFKNIIIKFTSYNFYQHTFFPADPGTPGNPGGPGGPTREFSLNVSC